MFKAGRSRFAFLLAAILVLTLGVTLVGSTLATSFGDPVDYTTALQSLEGGNTLDYQIDLNYYSGSGYVSMLDSSAVFSSDALWCPGRTEIVYLQLTNNEAFPVDCELSLNASLQDNNSGFVNSLSYAVIADDLKAATATHPSNWNTFVSNSIKQQATPLSLGSNVLLGGITAETAYRLAAGSTTSLAVAVHMNEDATNQYAGKTLELSFGLRVNANYAPKTTLPPTK